MRSSSGPLWETQVEALHAFLQEIAATIAHAPQRAAAISETQGPARHIEMRQSYYAGQLISPAGLRLDVVTPPFCFWLS